MFHNNPSFTSEQITAMTIASRRLTLIKPYHSENTAAIAAAHDFHEWYLKRVMDHCGNDQLHYEYSIARLQLVQRGERFSFYIYSLCGLHRHPCPIIAIEFKPGPKSPSMLTDQRLLQSHPQLPNVISTRSHGYPGNSYQSDIELAQDIIRYLDSTEAYVLSRHLNNTQRRVYIGAAAGEFTLDLGYKDRKRVELRMSLEGSATLRRLGMPSGFEVDDFETQLYRACCP